MPPSRAETRPCRDEGRPTTQAPRIEFISCPVKETLGTLGQRWTLLVLRDVGVYGKERFSQILQANPGLTARVLSRRLSELQREGLVARTATSRKDVRYTLTPKGRDTLPILAAIVAYGITHHADRVFSDGKPRRIREAFPFAHETLVELVNRDSRSTVPAP
jgi:DNA-binding HxlR family transcriptional regulator